MSRRRRAILLAALAVLLGGLAASDVASREAALRRRLGPVVPIVVARAPVHTGDVLDPRRLGVRRVPARYAPRTAFGRPGDLRGLRAAADIPPGTDLSPALVRTDVAGDAGPIRPGQTVADIVARGPADLIRAGSRVDVLVTREDADGRGHTELALHGAEVLAAARVPDTEGGEGAAPRVALSLRVSVREAVGLAAAQDFARELRVLPRAPVDDASAANDDPGA